MLDKHSRRCVNRFFISLHPGTYVRVFCFLLIFVTGFSCLRFSCPNDWSHTPTATHIKRKTKTRQVSKGTILSSNILYIRKYPDLWNEVITVKKDFIFLFFFPLSILLFLSTFTFFKRFFSGPQLNLIIWKSEWVTVLVLRNIINSQYHDKLQLLSFLFSTI